MVEVLIFVLFVRNKIIENERKELITVPHTPRNRQSEGTITIFNKEIQN